MTSERSLARSMMSEQPASETASGAVRLRRLVPWLVLCLSLVVAMFSTAYVAASTRETDELRFARAVQNHVGYAQRRLETYIALLRGARAFVAVDRDLTPDEWSRYVHELELAELYPGIQGIGWAPAVETGEEAAFEAELRGVFPGYRVWPQTEQPIRAPIAYLVPPDRRNLAALGYDMYSEQTRRRAMRRAIDTGEPAATSRLVLVQEIDRDKQAGFLVYVPVYQEPHPDTPEQRSQSLRGFVYAPFRAGDLWEALLGGIPHAYLAFEVYDGEGIDPQMLLYDSPDDLTDRDPRFSELVTLEVAGRPWTLRLHSRESFEQLSTRRLVIPVALVGVLGALALFGLTLAQSSSREAAERHAAQLRTSEAALTQSERRFRELVEQSPLSTQIFSPDGETIRTNEAWERLWGFTLAELGGYNILEDPQLEEKGIAPLVREAFAGEPRPLPTIAYDPPAGLYKGHPRWVRAFIYPVKDDSGRVREVVLVHDDVTERVEAEEALRQAQRLESIGVLAGGIAHDFNNLLTGIMGFTSLATREAPPGTRLRGMLDQVLQAAGRAADLTRQLLAYAGKGRFFLQRLDVPTQVRELTDLLRSSISRKVTLDLDLGDEPLPVDADGTQLQQLVMNLVINAAEAMDDEAGVVRIRTRRIDLDANEIGTCFPAFDMRPGAYVQLVVEDSGVGMDAETIHRIFDPFFTTKFMGRGLGLAAALGIVRGHGGGIRVESAPGEGTKFFVALPLAPGAAPEPPGAQEEDLSGSGRVLIIDDEPMVRHAAREMLEGFGYRVAEASDGPEGIARYLQQPADLVLLDMTMPVMSGDEVLRELVRSDPNVRVLASSGYGEIEAMRRFAGTPVQGFVQKPYTAPALGRAVKAALARESGPAPG